MHERSRNSASANVRKLTVPHFLIAASCPRPSHQLLVTASRDSAMGYHRAHGARYRAFRRQPDVEGREEVSCGCLRSLYVSNWP